MRAGRLIANGPVPALHHRPPRLRAPEELDRHAVLHHHAVVPVTLVISIHVGRTAHVALHSARGGVSRPMATALVRSHHLEKVHRTKGARHGLPPNENSLVRFLVQGLEFRRGFGQLGNVLQRLLLLGIRKERAHVCLGDTELFVGHELRSHVAFGDQQSNASD